MAIQVQGNGGTVAEVETAFRSNRVTIYPQDPGTLGCYSLAVDNGATAMAAGLAAAAPIFAFRWGSSNVAMIRRVAISAYNITTAFTAGRGTFDMFVARAWSASDTGGTAVAFSASKSNAKRTSMGATLVTDVRISATATLTAGTRTLDTNPIAKVGMIVPPTTINYNLLAGQNVVLWQRDSSDEYPLVLAQNEGFVIQATLPATGTWYFGVTVEWAELASF